MHHVAIMKKSWGLTEKILLGEKTIESRWSQTKKAPFGRVKKGDTIYFKEGRLVSLKAKVSQVLQFEDLNDKKKKEIMKKYGEKDLGISHVSEEIEEYIKNKNYCVLIFLKDIKKVKLFNIDKKGFGAMSSWLIIDNIDSIKL